MILTIYCRTRREGGVKRVDEQGRGEKRSKQALGEHNKYQALMEATVLAERDEDILSDNVEGENDKTKVATI